MSMRGDLASRPGLVRLVVASWLWHFTRFGGLFAASYLATKMSDVDALPQLVGAALFVPMMFGLRAGALTRRFDQQWLVRTTQLVQLPVLVAMAIAVAAEAVQLWMLFPFMVVLGLGNLANMTAQRTLMADVAGPALAVRVLAVDSVSVASTMMAGPLLCGAVIGAMGRGAAFFVLALAHVAALVVGMNVSHQRVVHGEVMTSSRGEIRRGLALMRSRPALVSLILTTGVMDLLYFSFMPLVPSMAERFDASPGLTGALGGAAGFGSFIAAALIASSVVRRFGLVYAIGSVIALAGLGAFALSPVVGLAFLALFTSGVGNAGFTATQSGLTIESVRVEERATAMGVVTLTIGLALPLGMVLLGASAQLIGARGSLIGSSLVGLAALGAALSRYPHVLHEGEPERIADESPGVIASKLSGSRIDTATP